MSVYRPTYTDKKTGEVKTSAVWWYHFTYNGEHYQESSGDTRKTIAKEKEQKRRLELKYGAAGRTPPPQYCSGTVGEALDKYQKVYRTNHRPDSIIWLRSCAKRLVLDWGNVPVQQVNTYRVAAYIEKLKDEGAAGRSINMLIDTLARAIGGTRRSLWPKLGKQEENTDIGRALSKDEEARLLAAAAQNKSPYVLSFLRIGLFTGLRIGEIKKLRWSQIDFVARTLTVGKSKSKAGTGRAVPMNGDLYDTLRDRAAVVGPFENNWYVFPWTKRGTIDVTKPVTTLKTSWESVRKAAGVECRFHDLRHTAVTKMIEAGVPEGTIMALVGHVSRKMLDRYSHVRMEAMRKAVEALSLAEPAKVSAKVAPNATVQ